MRDRFKFILSEKYEDVFPIYSKTEYYAEEHDYGDLYVVESEFGRRFYSKFQIEDFIANGDWIVVD